MNARDAMRMWLSQHARAAISALGQLRRKPGGSLMTTAAIGIALALPAAFLLVMDNIESAMSGWDGTPRASVFLALETPPDRQAATAERIAALDGIQEVTLISPAEALAEFQATAGMDETLALLDANPLPAVVEARLRGRLDTANTERLMNRLQALPHVEEIRLDQAWMQRLDALLDLGNRTIAIIALLLGLTVVLVIGNTIRLDIENRRSEIEITKLIGATDAFIRRPFLYTGVWYGLAGGLLSGVILIIGILAVSAPARRLATLYQSAFQPTGPGVSGILTLLTAGLLLGLFGAWLAVGRHLAAIEPQ
ncbi:permease-like cell division protein FtsX [Spiribacter sp. 221]|uniref:permease-like cell division protein FtsX n=1 Tax=Spiribacter onubensis TaxID=3122420 RepID=UPI00349F7BAA